MAEPLPQQDVPQPNGPDEGGIVALFLRLIDDAERFVRAEMRLYRAQLFDKLRQARSAILLGVVAFLLAQSAIITTLVGLVLILRHAVGLEWAVVIVVVGGFAVAGLLVHIAVTKVRKLTEIRERADK